MNEERFFRAYKALKDIETANDLRRAGLTLAEFREVQYCLQKYAASNGEEGAWHFRTRPPRAEGS